MDERCTCAATMAHGPATTQRMDTYLFDRYVSVGTLKEAPAASLKAGRDGGGNGNHHTLVALRSDRSAGGFVQGPDSGGLPSYIWIRYIGTLASYAAKAGILSIQ